MLFLLCQRLASVLQAASASYPSCTSPYTRQPVMTLFQAYDAALVFSFGEGCSAHLTQKGLRTARELL